MLCSCTPSCSGVPLSQVLDVTGIQRRATTAANLALPSLPHLQRLYLPTTDVDELPPGPWLRNIRWLCAPYGAVANSVAVLQGAHELEYIEMYDWRCGPEWSDEADAALLDWLAQHPPLRRVQCSGWSKAEVAELASRRPGLRVNRGDCFLKLLEAEDCS